jgi:O-acetyl-ADP-ribose deacetylase (regulator of RNase III)
MASFIAQKGEECLIMSFQIIKGDITKMKVDAIVNAANTELKMGGGVCGAIFRGAGPLELKQECDEIGQCPTGQAVITKGYRLPAKYIIHTSGPVWGGGKSGEAQLLHSCYLNSLKLAQENGCASIAFPLISSGIYGYPKDEALKIATSEIKDFLSENDMDVYLVIYDKSTFLPDKELIGEVGSFIEQYYVGTHKTVEQRPLYREDKVLQYYKYTQKEMVYESMVPVGLDKAIDDLEETFSQKLFRIIDAKGKTDVEVYKRANLDRKLFSKIRSNKGYIPSKRTAVALAIALELDINQTKDLLGRAGYTLSPSQKFDVIIEYFISKGNYNIFEINQALFYFDQPLLGG